MKNLIIFHQNMVMGGVEKVTLNLLKNLDKTKFNIKLILIQNEGELLSQIPKDIEIIFLLKKNYVKNKNIIQKIYGYFFELLLINKKLKELLIQDDAIFLIMNARNFRLNISLLKYKNPKIGWYHSTITSDLITILTKVNYKLLKQYKIIYNVSKDGKKDFDRKISSLKGKSKLLYNSFDINKIKEKSFEKLEENNYILAVGRILNSHKGFDVLVDAMKKLKDEKIKIKLYIIGDGPDKEKLKEKISKNYLSEDIIIKGFDNNPYKWMKKSKGLILSSNYEGLPTVLIEALACETPIVSTDCKCGPSEILNNGEYGILVPVGDSEALKEGIKKILLNEKLRKELKEKSLKRALDFSNEKIIKQLENQILEL